MFQVILIFSDRILTENHSFLHPFCLGRNRFSKNSIRGLSGGLGHEEKSINSMIFWEYERHKLKNFSCTCWNIKVKENSASILERQNPKGFQEVRLILKDKGGKKHS